MILSQRGHQSSCLYYNIKIFFVLFVPLRLPYTFVTKEVVEATCECLLDQARQTELSGQPQALAERLVLEEFGHCLMRIISSAGKAKSDCINC